MSQGEVNQLLKVGVESYNEELYRYIDQNVNVLNAPHFRKEGESSYVREDFLKGDGELPPEEEEKLQLLQAKIHEQEIKLSM